MCRRSNSSSSTSGVRQFPGTTEICNGSVRLLKGLRHCLATKTSNILIRKGLNNRYVLWLSSFLENRQARFRFNGSISRSRKNHEGLPQGSVLAPLLFVLYNDGLNEMPEMSGKHRTTHQETRKPANFIVKLVDVTKHIPPLHK